MNQNNTNPSQKEKTSKENYSSASQSRMGSNFIPYPLIPDNGPFFGNLSNPLSSKGLQGTTSETDDFPDQFSDDNPAKANNDESAKG